MVDPLSTFEAKGNPILLSELSVVHWDFNAEDWALSAWSINL